MFARVDDEDAFVGHPAARNRSKAFADLVRQRVRSGEVEPELNGGRHLVDVLTARSGRADEAFLDVAVADLQPRRDVKRHGGYRVIQPAMSRITASSTWPGVWYSVGRL